MTQKELLMAAKAKAEAELRVIDANALLDRYHSTVIRYSDYCLLGAKRCAELLPGASIRVSNRFEEPTVTAVKETYENVYCTLNDFKVQFPKCTKDVKGFYRFIKSNYEMNQKARVTK